MNTKRLKMELDIIAGMVAMYNPASMSDSFLLSFYNHVYDAITSHPLIELHVDPSWRKVIDDSHKELLKRGFTEKDIASYDPSAKDAEFQKELNEWFANNKPK